MAVKKRTLHPDILCRIKRVALQCIGQTFLPPTHSSSSQAIALGSQGEKNQHINTTDLTFCTELNLGGNLFASLNSTFPPLSPLTPQNNYCNIYSTYFLKILWQQKSNSTKKTKTK